MNTVKIISLGCSKNTVDSEVLAANLSKLHWTLIPQESTKNPEVLIINTCGFIGDAKEESIETILTGLSLKQMGKIKKLCVAGCLSQRYADDLPKEIEGVDAWFGVDRMKEICEFLCQTTSEFDGMNRVLSTPSHYAYLKIAEGCNRRCAFCAIPLIRGPYISRTLEDLRKEAEILVAKGVKELILISQDVSYYGTDLYSESRLDVLIKSLAQIEDLEWIRLQYLYPHAITDKLVDLLKTEPKLCKYIDMPLQHISTDVLHAMQRPATKENIIEMMERLRKEIPQAAFRTTMITGFPNEKQEDFEALLAFVEAFRFERLGVFTYSPEEGTSAYDLEDNVSAEEKMQRADRLMDLQETISLQLNTEKIGKRFKVLIDREEGDYYVGRTEYDSPEVDNEVLIDKRNRKLKIGCFYELTITEAEVHDLYAS